jgi:hypothetical protein
MIDIETYKEMHVVESSSEPQNRHISEAVVNGQDDIGPNIMSKDEPPSDDKFLLCLPNTIVAFNMNAKKWSLDPYSVDNSFANVPFLASLDMSRITIVNWDRNLFESLVLENSTKELVFALVTSHDEAQRAANQRATHTSGGNRKGLIILLHG